ncbi:MAG: dihydrofolate synthase/folylpolyglutamate synthase [Bacteroidia bacterium]
MTYEQTLDYLYAKLPMYQRVGAVAFKKDLGNIVKLCKAMGNPQRNLKMIHVAGTNGKGSTSHILSAVYQANGYKVGLYTSPHLVDFRERIKVNGELCTQQFVINFTESIAEHIEQIQPSFFEITVAMAFSYFAQEQVDVAIIETGLGGRLDSTNIITPLASIITSIGYDHKDMLGDTLELIAAEKAGIIKESVPVIVGHIEASPLAVIQTKATELQALLYHYKKTDAYSDLQGKHQRWNIGCAVQCEALLQDTFPTNAEKTLEGLASVCSLTQFEGRWQTVNQNPLVVCDVAHNEEGLQLIAEQLIALQKGLHLILGFVKDKDLEAIIPLLPKALSISLVKPNVIRGMETELAAQKFNAAGLAVTSYTTIQEAIDSVYETIKANETTNDSAIFIGGSNFVVADFLLLEKTANTPWK